MMSVTPLAVLIRRKRIGKRRIHNGEKGTVHLNAETPLEAALFIGEHKAVAGFAARGSYRQNHSNRYGLFNRNPAEQYIRNVGVICYGMRRAFAGIDYAAAAHS